MCFLGAGKVAAPEVKEKYTPKEHVMLPPPPSELKEKKPKQLSQQTKTKAKKKKTTKTSDPKPQAKKIKRTFVVTAYTAGPESTGKAPGDKGYGITASGKKVQEGTTLACPKSMPFGTRVHIEGLGERVCQDRGGAITEGRLDVYMPTVKEARQFGRQEKEVEILKGNGT